MIIDFHTHIFPDKIAAGTIKKLAEGADSKAFAKGTAKDLKRSMKEAGIDISVVLPVVTNPQHFESVNAFAAKISSKENDDTDGIISFGGIHPDTEDYKKEIHSILEYQLPGIKLHPDYQKSFVDERKTVRIVQYAIDHGLHVVFHAGVDIGLPDPVHCTPENTHHMLEQLEYGRKGQGQIILAHMGGHLLWDTVEKYLVGKRIYFDLAYNIGKIPDEQLMRIMRNHGVNRILFGTDSPWDNQKEDVAYFKKLPLHEDEKKAILEQNALSLLPSLTKGRF